MMSGWLIGDSAQHLAWQALATLGFALAVRSRGPARPG
jgi:hypothetical protein